MKKIIPMTLILSALLVFALACSAFAADVCTGTTKYSMYFRSAPSSSSELICTLPKSTVFTILECDPNGWSKVLYGDQIGYVASFGIIIEHCDLSVSYIGINGESFNCETGGTKESRCQNCSYVYSEEVPAGDHQLGYSVGISTDCDVDVENVTFCTICDWEEVEVIPAPGHILVWSIGGFPGQKFSCETGGIKFIRCSRSTCNYHTEELIPPGHDYQEVAKVEPTYHSSGTQTMQCSYCGHRDYITIPALVDDGMTEDFFLLGQTFMTGTWKLFQIYVPGFGFTFGGMLIGIALVGLSLSVLHMLFGFGGRSSGTAPRTSSSKNPKIAKERKNDEY